MTEKEAKTRFVQIRAKDTPEDIIKALQQDEEMMKAVKSANKKIIEQLKFDNGKSIIETLDRLLNNTEMSLNSHSQLQQSLMMCFDGEVNVPITMALTIPDSTILEAFKKINYSEETINFLRKLQGFYAWKFRDIMIYSEYPDDWRYANTKLVIRKDGLGLALDIDKGHGQKVLLTGKLHYFAILTEHILRQLNRATVGIPEAVTKGEGKLYFDIPENIIALKTWVEKTKLQLDELHKTLEKY